MTENKLTEAEIMKALECCAESHCKKECAYFGESRCNDLLILDTLSLINRKNAECKNCGIRTSESIEKLQKQIAEKTAEIEVYKERFEMLDSNSQMAIGYADALEERARAEAIKEYKERVKKLIAMCNYDLGDLEDTMLMEKDIDQIAKEMGVEL